MASNGILKIGGAKVGFSDTAVSIFLVDLKLLLKNKSLIAYNSKPRIMVISLGKWDGILIYKQFTLTGIIPGIMKTMIEKMFMRKL